MRGLTSARGRQLNVQEQNALVRAKISETAVLFREEKDQFRWVAAALENCGVDPLRGILASASTIPCGGNSEVGYASWLSVDGRLLQIVATLSFETGLLESVEEVTDVTESDGMKSRRGTGKSFGCLAAEVLLEVLGSNYALKPTAEQALRTDRGAPRRGGLTRR